MADKPEVISTEKARGGTTPHIVRYMLLISLVLGVAAMAFALFHAPTVTAESPATTAAQP